MSMPIWVYHMHMQYISAQLHSTQSSDHYSGLLKLAKGPFYHILTITRTNTPNKCSSRTKENTNALIWEPHCGFRVVRITAYLKTIIEDYGKEHLQVGPIRLI